MGGDLLTDDGASAQLAGTPCACKLVLVAARQIGIWDQKHVLLVDMDTLSGST